MEYEERSIKSNKLVSETSNSKEKEEDIFSKTAKNQFKSKSNLTNLLVSRRRDLENKEKERSKTVQNFYKTYQYRIKNQVTTKEKEYVKSERELNYELRNSFQISIAKLNDSHTKDIGYKEILNLIIKFKSSKALRIIISLLSIQTDNSSLLAKESQVMLIGVLSQVYKSDLIDPLDSPPSLLKTLERLMKIIHLYMKEPNEMIHIACADSFIKMYKYSMPKKDNDIDCLRLFFDYPIKFIEGGTNLYQQKASCLIMSRFIQFLSKDLIGNLYILKLVSPCIHALLIKTTFTSEYRLFDCFYYLINNKNIEMTYFAGIKSIINKVISVLKNEKSSDKVRLSCVKILSSIGNRIRIEISSGNTDFGIYPCLDDIKYCLSQMKKDRIFKIQIASREGLSIWNEVGLSLNRKEEEKYEKKEEIKGNTMLDSILDMKNRSQLKVLKELNMKGLDSKYKYLYDGDYDSLDDYDEGNDNANKHMKDWKIYENNIKYGRNRLYNKLIPSKMKCLVNELETNPQSANENIRKNDETKGKTISKVLPPLNMTTTCVKRKDSLEEIKSQNEGQKELDSNMNVHSNKFNQKRISSKSQKRVSYNRNDNIKLESNKENPNVNIKPKENIEKSYVNIDTHIKTSTIMKNFTSLFNEFTKEIENKLDNIKKSIITSEKKVNQISKKVKTIKKIKEEHENQVKPNENQEKHEISEKEIGKIWEKSILLCKSNKHEEAFEIILNSTDDIYLIRLFILNSSSVIKKIKSIQLKERVIKRLCEIFLSHQLEKMNYKIIKEFYNDAFDDCSLDVKEVILKSLLEYSEIDSKALDLYHKMKIEVDECRNMDNFVN